MTITFSAICNLLQSIENVSAKGPRPRPLSKQEQERIQQVVLNWFRVQRDALDNPATDDGAVLSVLFPHRRRDRVYGLQAPLLAKKLSRLLTFNHGQRALFESWKTGAHGDLGVYVERAMKPWDGTFSNKSDITIEIINHVLVQLAANSRFSDEKIRRQRDPEFSIDRELRSVFMRLESWEAKWLVRLLLRDYCTIELNERLVMRCYHFLLPELLAFQNDFEAAFHLLKGELSCYPAVPEPREEESLRIEAAKRLKARVGTKIGRPTFYKAWSLQNCIQLLSDRVWAAEIKYDGEFCEIHVDLENRNSNIQIFSKNGKDATADREGLHSTIHRALRIGRSNALFRRNCIVVGEMVVYSDKEKKIMPFSRIRKHVTRSGSFKGTLYDSPSHTWEHLMVVFFDVLTLDDEPVLRHSFEDRRKILHKLIHVIPGRSMRSEWTLLDFKTGSGLTDLKQTFARSLAERQEGLVLKPLHASYLPLLSEKGHRQSSFFVKIKKDYLGDMGGERDLGDFAVIGASFDAQVATKTNLKPLHWTHFYLGCCINRDAVVQTGAKAGFNVVASLSIDKCIPRSDAQYLNTQGYIRQVTLHEDGSTAEFDVANFREYSRRISVAFKNPLIVEILGGGFERVPNASFEMLRHPRVQKIHQDRTWEDAVTMQDVERMAEKKFAAPDAEKLDGHARDVALLVKKYVREMNGSQETTQRTSPSPSQDTPHSPSAEAGAHVTCSGSEVQQMQAHTDSDSPSSQDSADKSTRAKGLRASRELRSLARDTSTQSLPPFAPQLQSLTVPETESLILCDSSALPSVSSSKRRSLVEPISPPRIKRRKTRCPLQASDANRQLGRSSLKSQEKAARIHDKENCR
jgi:DNA ligase-4